MESILKYKNGFKNNLMYKEIFNQPFFENSNRHMNEGLTLLIAISESTKTDNTMVYLKIDNSTKTDNTMLYIDNKNKNHYNVNCLTPA